MTADNSTETTTILVVDDTPTNLQVLFELLHTQGYRVATATSGETALERLDSFLPALILLDVMMTGIDGFETCRQIKESEATRDIPIIFMTALSDPVDKIKGLGLGAVDYITKPFQHEEVLARIQVHLKLRELNQSLALRVAERDQSLKALQQTQMQLIQAEKMSSLGQMMAGIAHEINNPISFVHGNVVHMGEYCQNLLEMIQFYQDEYPSPSPMLQQQAAALDIAFVREDLSKIMESMHVGTKRIRQLVLSLRNFSRLDESACKVVDIHEGIDSTVLILQHRLQPKDSTSSIHITYDFDNLPPVECYPSQLNQVIMNLLVNAIDAIESHCPDDPSITIRTTKVDETAVQIAIADNGPGIPESIQHNLFDPFFTTKPIGEGTGLGLSISHQIVTERHGGKIDCYSTVGQGTEFVVEIPVRLTDN